MEVRKELRAVIKFLAIEQVLHEEILMLLNNVLDASASEGRTAKMWASLHDDSRAVQKGRFDLGSSNHRIFVPLNDGPRGLNKEADDEE